MKIANRANSFYLTKRLISNWLVQSGLNQVGSLKFQQRHSYGCILANQN